MHLLHGVVRDVGCFVDLIDDAFLLGLGVVVGVALALGFGLTFLGGHSSLSITAAVTRAMEWLDFK